MRHCPLKRVNNSLRKVKYCYGNFLLAETELVMTTLMSSHVKDKNRFFTGYEIFFTGKFVVFHRYLYNDTQLAPEGEVNSGGYIPRCQASRYISVVV